MSKRRLIPFLALLTVVPLLLVDLDDAFGAVIPPYPYPAVPGVNPPGGLRTDIHSNGLVLTPNSDNSRNIALTTSINHSRIDPSYAPEGDITIDKGTKILPNSALTSISCTLTFGVNNVGANPSNNIHEYAKLPTDVDDRTYTNLPESDVKVIGVDFKEYSHGCDVSALTTANSTNEPLLTDKSMRVTIYGQAGKKAFFTSHFENITKAQLIPECTSANFDNSTKQLKGQTRMCHGTYGNHLIIITTQIGEYGATSTIIPPDILTIPPLGSVLPAFGVTEFTSDPDNDGQLYRFYPAGRYADSGGKHDIYIQENTRTLVTSLFTGVDDYSCSARVGNFPHLINNNYVPNLAIPNNISPKTTDSIIAVGLNFYNGTKPGSSCSPDIEATSKQPLITDKDMRVTIYNNIDKKPYYFSPRDGILQAQPIPACTTDIIDTSNNNALKSNNSMCYGINGTGSGASIVIVTKHLTGFYGVATSITDPTNPMKFQYGGATVPLVDKSTLLDIPPIGSLTPSFKIMQFKSDTSNDGQVYQTQDTARYQNSDKKYDIYMEQNARTLVTSLFAGVDDFSCMARVTHIPGLITDNRVPNLAAPANIQPRLVSSLDAVGLDFYNGSDIGSSCSPNMETLSEQPLILDKDMRITMSDTDKHVYYFSPRDGILEAQPIPACTSDIIDRDNNNALKSGNTMCYGVNATTGPKSIVIVTKCLTGFYGATGTLFVPTKSVNPNNMCGKSTSNGSGDDYLATAPTFGRSQFTGEQVVTCGYKMDDTCRDVTAYHVQYERNTIQTNTTHTFALKAHAPNLLNNVMLAFSVPAVGAPMSTAEAYISINLGINYSEPSYHYITDVTIHDPNNIIDYDIQTTTVSKVSCSGGALECIQVTIPDVLFREVMNHEPFAIQVTDTLGLTSINYMNEGVFVEGPSLNAPPTVQPGLTLSRDDGRPVNLVLVRTDKVSDLWADAFGNTWSRNSFGHFVIVQYAPYAGTTPVCTDINDRICTPFKIKLDWHNQKMIELRDSLYDAYKTKAYAEIDNIFTYEFGDMDSRTRTLINLGWLIE